MTIIYFFIMLGGIVGICFGFWGQSSLQAPYDTVAAVILPFSLILTLLAALLLYAPRFFF